MIQKDELLIRLMNFNDFEVMVKWLNVEKVLDFYEEPPSNIERVIKNTVQESKENIMLPPV